MKIYIHPEPAEWPALLERPVMEAASLDKKVRRVLEAVRRKGDRALRRYTREFDGARIKKFQVTPKEFAAADNKVPEELKAAIQLARFNIERFHQTQIETPKPVETMPGVRCWRENRAIEKVGIYIPGGTAPLFSTILMLAVPASLAGCKEIILCSPPNEEGKLHPAILYTAMLAGVTAVYKLGGIQAIGAMAYGTESVPAVYKIFGPGNQYVTAAKKLVQQEGLAIDMPAGPSEVMVFADETADPSFIAADLLSQAEHGIDSQAILVTTDKQLPKKVTTAIEKQLENLPRKELAEKALENSRILVFKDRDESLAFINQYAAEHLILACAGAEVMASRVQQAGSVFLGHYSPESAGDYASGTNHTLPTNGYARAYSGVSVDSFVKKITFQQLNKEGLEHIGNAVIAMAEAEGLQAHAEAVKVRLIEK
ncbi:MAG: histidinol dehydrogenase [Sphingobacteriales bacterium 12-47-4]|nr:MAG: histidinol dehydrogenase [Sphingobacteriales bacterium 12-47-4]